MKSLLPSTHTFVYSEAISFIKPETPRRSSLGICHPSPTQVRCICRDNHQVRLQCDAWLGHALLLYSNLPVKGQVLPGKHYSPFWSFSLVNASLYLPGLGHGRQGDCKEPSLEEWRKGCAEEGCDNAISVKLHQSSIWESRNDMSRNQCLVRKVI